MEGEHQHDNGGAPQPEQEHGPGLRPRIYVASLADYNAGRLHGVWLEADGDLNEMEEVVQEMLRQSPEPGAEEFAIHDYEEFGCIQLHEYTGLATVNRLARGLAEHGCAFGFWADYVGLDPDEMDRFEDVYRGRWDTLSDYASELLDDLGIAQELQRTAPEWIKPYLRIDTEALGTDLASNAYVAQGLDGVWIFVA